MSDRRPALEQQVTVRLVDKANKMSAYLRSYDIEERKIALGRMLGYHLAHGMTPEQRIAANTRVSTVEESRIVAQVGRTLDKLAGLQGELKIKTQ